MTEQQGTSDGSDTPGTDPLEDSVVDRRSGLDRRRINEQLAKFSGNDNESGEETTLDRRRGPGRRRSDFTKSAEEGEMTKEQFLFLLAIDEFKKANGKTFPSWTDVLEVIRLLGYRKTTSSEIAIPQGAEDWLEKPEAPSGVRDITNPSER